MIRRVLPKCREIALVNFSQTRTHLYSRYKHGPFKKHNPNPPYLKWIKEFFGPHGIEFTKSETQRILQKPFNNFHQRNIEDDEEVIFEHFDDDEMIRKWKPVADSDVMTGNSVSNFIRSPSGHGLFTGLIDNRVPDDGLTTNSGFAGLIGPTAPRDKLLQSETFWNWDRFTSIVLRFRGDGRKYSIVLNTAQYSDDTSYFDVYMYPLYTRGGPYWQTVRIPFSKFLFCNRSYIQDTQIAEHFPIESIKFVGFNIKDTYDGPFSLELDYVGLRKDVQNIEHESPYETYTHPHIKFRQIMLGADPPDEE